MKNKSFNTFSPKISRFITELFSLRGYLAWIFWVLALILVWQGIVLAQNLVGFYQVFTTRQNLSSQRELWTNISSKFPGYRDAYFQIAQISYELGDIKTENMYLEKTLSVDPNFLPAQSLEKLTQLNNIN